ncbi:MAG: hypothetical protein KDK89_19165 [Alphaproteobacteria bacterium]|nr:hypothetical protein [Alphaproteobacteria bacterium]
MNCQKGTVAVEYTVITSAMFLAIIPGFYYVSSSVGLKFDTLAHYFNLW